MAVQSRSDRLDRAIHALLSQTPEIEAAAVVSFDGLPMAAALPPSMDEDRVAAMSAALLSLGERAAQGLGRGELSQVYIEGDAGTVFLISADDEAVLVAVAAKGAKTGMMLYEVKRCAATVAAVLRADDEPLLAVVPEQVEEPTPAYTAPAYTAPTHLSPAHASPAEPAYSAPTTYTAPAEPRTAAVDTTWTPSYAPTASAAAPLPPATWS